MSRMSQLFTAHLLSDVNIVPITLEDVMEDVVDDPSLLDDASRELNSLADDVYVSLLITCQAQWDEGGVGTHLYAKAWSIMDDVGSARLSYLLEVFGDRFFGD